MVLCSFTCAPCTGGVKQIGPTWAAATRIGGTLVSISLLMAQKCICFGLELVVPPVREGLHDLVRLQFNGKDDFGDALIPVVSIVPAALNVVVCRTAPHCCWGYLTAGEASCCFRAPEYPASGDLTADNHHSAWIRALLMGNLIIKTAHIGRYNEAMRLSQGSSSLP